MKTFEIIYTLFGGLGLFFFGMKSMSDGLQAIAGDVIKNAINLITKNRFLAVLVGVFVTMLIQSSSVTTVMVVGFVNAGLMSLVQAVGVIFGANIGTTITGWIISIKVGKYGLLLIAIGIFPLLFSKTQKWRQIGRICFSIGLIFAGLETMSGALRPLRGSPEVIEALSYFSGNNHMGYLAAIGMGCIITMIFQSSSAMLGLTIAMATTGIISFPTAVALVFGENIGTTITAQLAAVGGNVNAKRAARAHAIFNVLGVIVIFIILPLYISFVEWIVPGNAELVSANGDRPNIAFHIAMSHSIFNISSTLIFIPFIGPLTRFVTKIVPDSGEKEITHLVVLGNASELLPATAIVQAFEEVKKLKEIILRQYSLTTDYFKSATNDPKMFSGIKKYEAISDNIQKEVTLFVCKLMEKSLTPTQSRQCQALVKLADEFESIADYLERMATYKDRYTEDVPIDGETGAEFFSFVTRVWDYFLLTTSGIDGIQKHNQQYLERKSDEIKLFANSIKDNHLQRIKEKKYNAKTVLAYSDLVVALRKIRSHSVNIAQAAEAFHTN